MAAPLPAGWQEFADGATGNPYFHNAASGETTWTRPSAGPAPGLQLATVPGFGAQAAAASTMPAMQLMAPAAMPAAAQFPLPEGWVEYVDQATKNPYYHRTATGETTWTRPLPAGGLPPQFLMGGGFPMPGMPGMPGMPQAAFAGLAIPGLPPNGMPVPGVMVTGTVKTWNEEKGFGFIIPDDPGANDLFVHRSSLADGNMLEKGAKIQYELSWNAAKNKYAAVKVMGSVNNPTSAYPQMGAVVNKAPDARFQPYNTTPPALPVGPVGGLPQGAGGIGPTV